MNVNGNINLMNNLNVEQNIIGNSKLEIKDDTLLGNNLNVDKAITGNSTLLIVDSITGLSTLNINGNTILNNLILNSSNKILLIIAKLSNNKPFTYEFFKNDINFC